MTDSANKHGAWPALARKTATVLVASAMGLASVATVDAKTVSKKFSNPQVGGRWVDVCYAHGACREQTAANTYCKMQGYQRAARYSSRVDKLGHQNVRIGDNSVCTNITGNCHRFTVITCESTVASNPKPAPKPGVDPGAALAIGVGAAIIGGILGQGRRNDPPPPQYQPAPPPQYQPQPAPVAGGGGLSPQHIDWCYAKYKSYRASTNTFTGYDGQQHYCVSPYG